MKNRSRKCGSCINFTRWKNDKRSTGLCEFHDWRCDTDSSGCKYWKGTEIPTRVRDNVQHVEVDA